jgi:hypothetical protein
MQHLEGEGMETSASQQVEFKLDNGITRSAALRERIIAALIARFPAYGQDTGAAPRNALAVTLAEEPPTFAWGVKIADVVDAVLELAQGVQQ